APLGGGHWGSGPSLRTWLSFCASCSPRKSRSRTSRQSMAADHPHIDDAPGLIWRKRKRGWEARWHCRQDLSRRGYELKGARLWVGDMPDAISIEFIQSECRRLQTDMLIWG